MDNLYNSVAAIYLRMGVIFDYMIIKDGYEAGLMSEDAWKSYLKQLMDISTKENKEEVKGEQRKEDTGI